MERTISRRQAIASAGIAAAFLIGARAQAQTVPKHVSIVETVNVFNTENHGREVSVLLKTNTILSVRGELVRSGAVLASAKQVLAAGSHDFLIRIRGNVASGPATLALTFTDELRRTKTTTQTVNIPRRR